MPNEAPSGHRARRRAGLLLLAATTMLAGGIGLSAMVHRSTQTLSKTVATTQGIVNANLRTIGQAQRELLRMELLLAQGSDDAPALDLQRSFVSQRMSETALDYQRQSLGSDELLATARSLRDRWERELSPLVVRIAQDGRDDDRALRQQALAGIAALELEVNDLVAAGETNRKVQAGDANEASRQLLDTSGLMLVGLAVSSFAFVVFVVVALGDFARSNAARERSETKLRSLNAELAKLSQVASRTGNSVIITDAHGSIEWVNDAFTAMTGFPAEVAIGRRPGALLQGPGTDEATVALMRRELRAGRGFTCEVLNRRADGAALWLALEVRPVHDETGAIINFIGISTDITQQRRTEQHLIAAKEAAEETAEAKASFLASMSHEIRTPLNAIIGMTDLLLGTDLTPVQHECVETTQRSGSMLLAVLNNILTYSALDAGKVELDLRPVDVAQVVRSVRRILAQEAADKGLSLEVDLDPSLPARLRTDEVRLGQILVNLTANAVKFTPEGFVQIGVHHRVGDDGTHLVDLVVRDSGIGIPADRAAKLFQPFSQVDSSTTRRFGGTGLGLAITRRLVRLLGGEITLDSALGHGTSVTVTIPMAVERAPEAAPAPEPPDVHLAVADANEAGGVRVLVAEDDLVNQKVTSRLLERLGVEVVLVADGAAALEAVHRERYDLVLMDVNMPGMDGMDATRHIRAELDGDRRPWIVAMTANALPGDRERFLDSGFDDYLSKPVRLADLAEVLERTPAAV